MDYHATLLSLKKLAINQYEATFTYDGSEYVKSFEVLKHHGYEEISINDSDLEPRLALSDDTRRALFAFHRSFREPDPVEKRSLAYLSRIRPNLTRPEKEKEQTPELLSSEEQKHAATAEEYGKKILTDPDTDIFHRPISS